VIFALVVLQCLSSTPASAQNANRCVVTTTWWFTDPIPFGWYYYSAYPGTFVYVIAAGSKACPPRPEASCSIAPPAFAGKPVHLCSGDTLVEQTDVAVPGLGGGLNLRRTWRSMWPSNEAAYSVGLFGPNWRSTYEERLFVDNSNHIVKYARGDGGFYSFLLDPDTGVFVCSPISANLTANGRIKFKDGEVRQFNPTTGLLTAITDRGGHQTQLTYDGLNRLTTVTDPASRHLYFNYPNGSSLLVSSVTSDFGVTLSYTYDTQGRLTQVTEPDLTNVSFTYNSQSQITSVTDSNGKVLESHTYDSTGRGLTASQANGVNAVTLSYPQ
jgi:YD repeat-containing protein